MPGAFAHLTLVNYLREPARLEAVPQFPPEAIATLLRHFKFCELGAVSPDYPYLCLTDAGTRTWADIMHSTQTGAVVDAAIKRLRSARGASAGKGLAWLLGYVSHLVADVTVHPVIEILVGQYQASQNQHRICEMHQDAFIFPRLNLGEIGLSQYLKSGIMECVARPGSRQLDPDIVELWSGVLRDVHGDAFDAEPPKLQEWHDWFTFAVDKVAEEGDRLVPLARHVAAGLGLVYPPANELDPKYFKGLKTPGGETIDYGSLFERVVRNSAAAWRTVARGVLEDREDTFAQLGNWNLDTGRDADGRLVFWEAA